LLVLSTSVVARTGKLTPGTFIGSPQTSSPELATSH
jgi:hypothetical protein